MCSVLKVFLFLLRPADNGYVAVSRKTPLDEYQKNYLKDLQFKNAKYVLYIVFITS